MVRENFSKVTFEQRLEEGKGVSHIAFWGQSLLGKENSKNKKGSEMGSVCCDQRTGGHCSCSRMSKEESSSRWGQRRGAR